MRAGPALVVLAAGGLAAATDGYVAPAVCGSCHAGVFRTWLQTGMGRSFGPIESAPPTQPATNFFHAASQRTYAVLQRDGGWFLRRRQTGYDGAETNVVEKQIHYVVGSGNHARTYLHRSQDGRLIELPLSWYAAAGGYWAMSPGYDRPNHDDFRRRVSEQCLFCHNAYPAGAGPGLAGGIDCQRCHGPGEGHARAAGRGAAPEAIRAAIVNPARLSKPRQLEVCLQCHLETTSRALPNAIRRYDRPPFSYRPGEPLAGYILHFDHPAGSAHHDKFEVNHAGYRLLRSRCFQQSPALVCATCHDPHGARRGQEAADHYRRTCLSCHADHAAGPDCVSCHMPKRRAEDAVHVVLTDHWIQRRPLQRDLLAPLDEFELARKGVYKGEVAPYPLPELPDPASTLLYGALAQVKDLANLTAGIQALEKAISDRKPRQAEFYLELAEAFSRAGRTDQALPYYRQAIRRKPDLARAYHRLGDALLRRGDIAAAVATLSKGLRMAPTDADIATTLGVAQGQAGRLDASVEILTKAVRWNPDYPLAWVNLGVSFEENGSPQAAEEAYRSAIRLQPDLASAHRRLANLLAARGDRAQARYHYGLAGEDQP